MQIKHKIGVASALLALAPLGYAQLNDEDMKRLMDSRTCPRDLGTYDTVKYADVCGQSPGRGEPMLEYVRCQGRVDRVNQTIFKFNDFLRECRRSVDRRYK